jgi:hypothetical protein
MLIQSSHCNNFDSMPASSPIAKFVQLWPAVLIGLGLAFTLIWNGLLVWFLWRLLSLA